MGDGCVNDDISKKMQNDFLMRSIYQYCKQDGLSYQETLEKMVIMLMDLKDEVFQKELAKRIHNIMPPFVIPRDLTYGRKDKRGAQE